MYASLESTPDKGPQFAAAIRHLMQARPRLCAVLCAGSACRQLSSMHSCVQCGATPLAFLSPFLRVVLTARSPPSLNLTLPLLLSALLVKD